MFKHTKKILSILMMVVMMIGCFSVNFSVFAEEIKIETQNVAGDSDSMTLNMSNSYCVIGDRHYYNFYDKKDNLNQWNTNPIDSQFTYNIVVSDKNNVYNSSVESPFPLEYEGYVSTDFCFDDFDIDEIKFANYTYWSILKPLFDYDELLKDYEVNSLFHQLYAAYVEDDYDEIETAKTAFFEAISEYDELEEATPDNILELLDQLAVIIRDSDNKYPDLFGLTDFQALRLFFDQHDNVEDLGVFALVFDSTKLIFEKDDNWVFIVCYSPITKMVVFIPFYDVFLFYNGVSEDIPDKFDISYYKDLDLCANGHQLYNDSTEYISSATCTTPGELVNISKCEVCNKTFYEHETIPAKGHQLGTETEKVITPVTCTEDGQKVIEAECKRCHETIEVRTETIPSVGHQLCAETERVVTPATCTAAGQKVIEAECQVCHEMIFIRNETIPATGHLHTREETTVIQEADCYHVEKKEIKTICEDCGQTIITEYEVGSDVQHGEIRTETNASPYDGTCIGNDYFIVKQYCTLCGQKVGGAIQPQDKPVHPVDENGNVVCYETRIEETPATCTAAGQRTTIVWCNDCRVEVSRKTETLQATGHHFGEFVETGRTNAACEKDGTIYYEAECRDCDAKQTKIEKIPATGHHDGNNDGKCDKCGKAITIESSVSFFEVLRNFFANIINFFKALFH